MHLSEKKLNQNLEKQIYQIFYQLMADFKTPQEVEKFFQDFLSQTARLSLAKKLAIFLFLDKKRGYENIKATLKVSSATVAGAYKKLSTPGIQLALKKIKAEEWADQWSKKISSALERILPK